MFSNAPEDDGKSKFKVIDTGFFKRWSSNFTSLISKFSKYIWKNLSFSFILSLSYIKHDNTPSLSIFIIV